MRVEELLLEAPPLPDSWDRAIYDPSVPFKKRVEYAKERAEQVGKGSARVAFKIPYKGKPTILKIAMNRKGAAQNEAEAQLMDDWYLKNIGIVVPVIDYDEESSYPTWIHMEYAPKISQRQLEKFFDGVPMMKITAYLDSLQGRNSFLNTGIPEELHENEYFQALQDLVLNFGIPAADFSRAANWGLYKGDPVIVDIGFTNETAKLYGQ